MIRISRGDVPDDLTERWQGATKQIREFFAALPLSPTQRIQHTPKYDPLLWKLAESPLRALFRDKCAYCETPLGLTDVEIDHFRPKGGAVDLNGVKSPEHYWWLAYEWKNLYPACRECFLTKGNKFPVKGQRAGIDTDWAEVQGEKPILLDPCADDPEKHLVFSEDLVTATTERGEVTIDILGLNRSGLVKRRRSAIASIQNVLLSSFVRMIGDEAAIKTLLLDLLSPARPFAAASRQYIHRWIREKPTLWGESLTNQQVDNVIAMVEPTSTFVSTRKVRALTRRYKEAEEMIARASPRTSRASRKFFFQRSQFITALEIHNFKVFKHLKIDLNPRENQKPWLVLLGENGTGKTSILEAATLALMSEEQRGVHGLQPSHFLRHKSREGYIKVHLAGYRKPFELRFRRGDDRFESNNNKLHTLLFSYGGTRLLPYSGYQRVDVDGHARVGNLFNPFLPLADAKSWLVSLRDKPFEYSARAIRQLLQHEGEGELRRRRGREASIKLFFNSLQTSSTLEQLSNGYQSVVALAVDIMQVMLTHWDAVEDSEGIVLIDEVDAHLHPRWRIEIIELLRKVFPRVQFIVTTHDPLCLVGTLPGEVYILRRDPRTKQILVQQKDVPRGLTADQVLTGFWFGLSSTVDDDTLRLLDEHRNLMRSGVLANDLRRRELETELRRRFGTFADTSLERMAQSVTAEIMQESIVEAGRDIDPQLRSDIREKVLRLVRERQQENM
ncbi:MAG TPA: AAA family ATPase [Pyrinomonadaceae bacterium]|nr:AAA family ATPase [Pyrinomonadaceae bacterium]